MADETPDLPEVTELLSRWRVGEETDLEAMVPQIYDELRSLANRYIRRGGSAQTLQPTELVNEAFVRLMGSTVSTNDRLHFLALTARVMRSVLVDRFRRRDAAKRGSNPTPVTLASSFAERQQSSIDLLDLHRALERFGSVSPRAAQIVELRFFAGLTNEEVAEVLGVSLATVAREWRAARVWLANALETPPGASLRQ
ncbi:MAG: ECF-type sigma factor [Acidobacteriota bacterium]